MSSRPTLARALGAAALVLSGALVLGQLPADATTTGVGGVDTSTLLKKKKDAWQGQTAGGGYLDVRLENTPEGKIKVRWETPTPTNRIRFWKITTTTSPRLTQHKKVYKVGRKKRSFTVAPASLVTPASGDYTFVKVSQYRHHPKLTTSSPTKWIKAPVTVEPDPAAHTVAVGTFNVKTWNDDSPGTPALNWLARTTQIYPTIVNSGVGVLALQETSGSKDLCCGSKRQYEAVRDDLNGAPYFGSWELSSDENWKKAGTTASGRQGTRILYDSSKYTLLEEDFIKVDGATSKDIAWTPWARLQDKSTNDIFTMVSLHFASGGSKENDTKWEDLRVKQTQKVIDMVNGFRAEHPDEQVIVAGDTNSTIFDYPDNGVHRAFVKAGFYDAFASNDVTNGEYPTTNSFKFPVEPSPHRRDYIMTKGPLKGSVSFHNWSYTSLAQVASDHFMQSAVIPIG